MSKSTPQPTTYLGNKQLHKQHSVMVEGGTVPRARVMDQAAIDKMLMAGTLSLKQHRAAEYVLGQTVRAGLYARGVNLQGSGVAGGVDDHVPAGLDAYSATMHAVRKRCGDFHEYILRAVIVKDVDVSAKAYDLKCLQEALDCVANERMGFRSDPVQWIKKAQKKAPSEGGKTECSV